MGLGRLLYFVMLGVMMAASIAAAGALEERLFDAVRANDEKSVQKFLGQGAGVNAKEDETSLTALHIAAVQGNDRMVKLLISKGADVNAKGPSNRTPLMFAAVDRRLDAMSALLEKGADVNAVDADRRTALHWAITGQEAAGSKKINKKDAPRAVKLLIQKGADVNMDAGWKKTPLTLAKEEGNKAVVRILMEAGAKQ